ncbi:not available [Yersinia enterocolitica]|nr:not available [Yersinia enterocolitica]
MGNKNCGNNITDGVNSGQFAGGKQATAEGEAPQ